MSLIEFVKSRDCIKNIKWKRSNLLCFCCNQTLTITMWGRKGLFHLTSSNAGTSGMGPEAELMEGSCLLACSPWLAQLALFFSPDHKAKYDIAHSGLGLLPSINNKENTIQTSPHLSLIEILPQVKFPPSKVC